jgi:hypothetical protein
MNLPFMEFVRIVAVRTEEKSSDSAYGRSTRGRRPPSAVRPILLSSSSTHLLEGWDSPYHAPGDGQEDRRGMQQVPEYLLLAIPDFRCSARCLLLSATPPV